MIQKALLKVLRILFSPFSLVYAIVLSVRNLFFDKGILKQTSFDIPVIVVGNLSVGGTGKTPQIEYFIRLLQDKYTIGVLSRGYKRSSEGFVQAHTTTKVEEIGDEPFQFFKKFPNITVAVDRERVNGIQKLLKRNPKINLVLLDDAYQHRKVKASFYTLLTAYDNRYTKDYVLPLGDLRETRAGAKRANAIVITKCPVNLTVKEKETIRREIAPLKEQEVFFSSISYDDKIISASNELKLSSLKKHTFILITGIAKPTPLLVFLKSQEIDFIHLDFPDHHNFKIKDLQKIKTTFDAVGTKNKLMLTTEKDYTRLSDKIEDLYSLSIQTSFFEDGTTIDRFLLNHLNNF